MDNGNHIHVEGKIIGFINRNREIPWPVVTVVASIDERFLAIYPAWDVTELLDMKKKEDLITLPDSNFIDSPDREVSGLSDTLRSFAFSVDRIITGTLGEINQGISAELSREWLTPESRQILGEYQQLSNTSTS